ncbi:hypothetical protein PIB30_064832 [Stylosanthes scabra]|uniref:Uncharacterized protein n=1 Tax=Stylosanthes scabra TaxID=79078 RepID=A0ABU6QM97_9FABA|nr:hypothetical protein [Stylosanthes scabra]
MTRPKRKGGLGFKDLRAHNQTLLVRILAIPPNETTIDNWCWAWNKNDSNQLYLCAQNAKLLRSQSYTALCDALVLLQFGTSLFRQLKNQLVYTQVLLLGGRGDWGFIDMEETIYGRLEIVLFCVGVFERQGTSRSLN